MGNLDSDKGYFIFSLDTELAWGYHDLDGPRTEIFSTDGTRERTAIDRVHQMLDEFNIVGTWALVGHLFYERCEMCEFCPVLEWQSKYESFNEIYDTHDPLWYGLDAIETLLTRHRNHEIAFHGYTHALFDESLMSNERARMEIDEWLRLGKRHDAVPTTVIFPRNRVGHLDQFRRAGFICYRGVEALPLWFRGKQLGKLIKHVDQVLALSPLPIYDRSEIERSSGMVNLQSSEHFFDFNRKLEMFLDAQNLHTLRLRRIKQGIQRAAREKKIVHIWAHPWEFRTKKDFEKLQYILTAVAEEIDSGRMQSVGMAELASMIMAERSQTA